MPRFDWYAATIREDVSVILPALAGGLGGEIAEGTPHNGYAMGHYIKVKDSTVATVFSGGRNGNPHAFASSDDTEPFVALVRSLWPVERNSSGQVVRGHHVTRMDSAIDFDDGPTTWDRLADVCLELADEKRIKVTHHGDWHRLEAGRTLRLGAPSSAVTLNLYEKGKELIGKSIDGGQGISPDLVRFEVRVRPEKEARFRAAEGTPVEAFGYADWSKELLYRVNGAEVERVHIKERRESDHERKMYWMIRQYGDALALEADNVGGWDRLGPALQTRFASAFEESDAEPDLSAFEGHLKSDGQPYMKPRPQTDRPF